MEKEFKFKIISESINNGVSATCKKYGISRTIYYRWLKRYNSIGVDGLIDIKKNYIPVNKTDPTIEKAILNLVKVYPKYGPKSLNYLLEELGYNISGSAVFNVLKRNQLTNKYKRVQYSKKKVINEESHIPHISELTSGECWIFWITDIGLFDNNKNIYTYTFFDIKSRISCSRIYSDISFKNFEDLLTSVALSVATTLNLKINHLCFFKDSKIIDKYENSFNTKIKNTLIHNGRDIKIKILNSHDNMNEIISMKEEYTEYMITSLIQIFKKGESFDYIKFGFQEIIRNYNLNSSLEFDDDFYAPIEYHNKLTNSKPILPLWAYIDRIY